MRSPVADIVLVVCAALDTASLYYHGERRIRRLLTPVFGLCDRPRRRIWVRALHGRLELASRNVY